MTTAQERMEIHTVIEKEIDDAKKNIPTPFVGVMNAVWWNGNEGRSIRSHMQVFLDNLGDSIKRRLSEM